MHTPRDGFRMPASPDPRPRRLCLVCESMAGGVRKHVAGLIAHFARPEQGLQVLALLGDRGEPGFRQEMADLERAGASIRIVESFRRSIDPRQDWRSYRFLVRQFREWRPDLVHTHGSKAGILGRLAARRCGIPRILHTPHVFAFQWATGWRRRVYLALERRAARCCDTILCVGAGQKVEALQAQVCPEALLQVIPNGVRLPLAPTPERIAELRTGLGLPARALVVGMVARLAPQKGVGHFLEAAAVVSRQVPEVLFVLIGGGPLEERMRVRARELGLSAERFRFLGHRERAEDCFPAFDLLVLSSLYEGLPYVLLEAMAWGLPVVATDVLGSRDVVLQEETGLLAPLGASALLAEAILRLLGDGGLRQRLGTAARERVREHFSLERFLEAHRACYSERMPPHA